MIQTCHFCDTTCVIGDRAVSVNRYSDTCCCQHTYCGQSDTIQTTYGVCNVDTYADQDDGDSCGFHTYSQTGNDCGCRACFGLVCNLLNGFVITGGVDFCDDTDNLTNDQTCDNCDGSLHVAKAGFGQNHRYNRNQNCCCIGACLQSLVRVCVFVTLNKECTDDGSQNPNCCQYQRIQSAFCAVVYQTQCDCRDNGTNIGFKQVSTHTCNVTNVVAYVIGDNCGVTRVILRDTCFNLTYQVSTNVGSLCVDTAANTTEQSNGGSTQRETEQDVCIACQYIDCAYAQKAQTNYAHTHNCAAAECDRQGFVHTACSSCVCSSYVCICCNCHTEEACQCGEDCTNNEADCCRPAYAEANQNKQYSCEDNQNFVFCGQERSCTLSDACSDFLHSVCTLVHFVNLTCQDESKQQRHDTKYRRQID